MPGTDNIAHEQLVLAIDWGSSRVRARIVDRSGHTPRAGQTPRGIDQCIDLRSARDQGFGGLIDGFCRRSLDELGLDPAMALEIAASGMITSREGWSTTAYVECPATVHDLAQQLTTVQTPKGRHVYLMPGLRTQDCSTHAPYPDVIRGEETQLIGALHSLPTEMTSGERLWLLPGTHSKWVVTQGTAIVDFETHVTGELYAAIQSHTHLGEGRDPRATDPFDAGFDDDFWAGFELGLQDASTSSSLLRQLFAPRRARVFDHGSSNYRRGMCSGLLIGHEVAGGLARYSGFEGIELIGRGALGSLYAKALDQRSIKRAHWHESVHSRGITAIIDGRA